MGRKKRNIPKTTVTATGWIIEGKVNLKFPRVSTKPGKVQRPKKGKGSYVRKKKHKG